MMKKSVAIALILAGLALAGCGGAQTEKLLETGNEAFAQQDYATALTDYQQAALENPELAEPIYNAANVQYRQGEYEQTNATLQVALANADEDLAAEGYFNLGNAHFQTEQYAEAVDAYTESLRLNPDDIDAKINLELALQKLQQEQQEQQQEEQNQEQQEQEQENQEQQEQDQQDQGEQSQEQQDQEQESQDEQSQDQQEHDQQSQDEQSQDEQDQENQDQQGQGEQEQDQQEENQDPQSQDEQSQGEQEEAHEQQDEADPQNGEEAGEQPEEQQPQAGQTDGEPTDQEQDPTEMSLGELLEMDGLSEEQARQLLVAAAQGTETLQEYLQQMYVFPYSDVEQDW